MKEPHQTPIAILGAGSWGTALALYLSRLGQEVRLWTYDQAHAQEMQSSRVNKRYLSEHQFSDTLFATSSLTEALANVNDVLIAVPSVVFRSTLVTLKPLMTNNMRIAWATKGLDHDSSQLLHHVAREILGAEIPLAVLSGPSFAREVAAGLPTAVVMASEDVMFANDLVMRFNSQIFRAYTCNDITGVEVGGVVKNVLAIATGISDGMGFGANARCALITRGLAEMTRLGLALGGHTDTFTGLSGVGDLVLTCTDDQSRNRRFGLAVGKGKNPTDAEKAIGQVVEGKRNAEVVVRLAHKHHVDIPI